MNIESLENRLAFLCNLISVRLWNFKDDGSKKARFLQCGDQVSRILFFEMEEHGALEAHRNEFLNYEVLKIWKANNIFLKKFG